jgi:hypothetical protein
VHNREIPSKQLHLRVVASTEEWPRLVDHAHTVVERSIIEKLQECDQDSERRIEQGTAWCSIKQLKHELLMTYMWAKCCDNHLIGISVIYPERSSRASALPLRAKYSS